MMNPDKSKPSLKTGFGTFGSPKSRNPLGYGTGLNQPHDSLSFGTTAPTKPASARKSQLELPLAESDGQEQLDIPAHELAALQNRLKSVKPISPASQYPSRNHDCSMANFHSVYFNMKTLSQIGGMLVLTILCGCASSGSHVLVGTKRPPIEPSLVKLYLRPPTQYEEIAIVSGESRNAFGAISAQGKMDEAIISLKNQAGKLGANGILLGGAGNEYGGSVGSGFGSATGYGTGFSSPMFKKAASGMAIYVTQE